MSHERINKFIENPRKALLTLSLPIIIGTIVQVLYNVVDTIYVGRLGAEALAAITFCFPLYFLLIAINSGITSGMSSRIARFLGEKKKAEAENTAMHGILLSLISSILLVAIGIPLLKPTFMLFGAEGHVLELSIHYMLVIYLGAIFMFLAFSYSSIFAAQGDTKTPMKIQIVSLILNAVLAPIFIFWFGWGIIGAALATSIAVTFSFIQALFYVRKVSYLHIHMSSFKFSPSILKEIFNVGFPAGLMILILSVYVVFLNRVMVHFSNDHVAAFGIVSRLESVAFMPLIGFSIGLMNLVGMFYGTKRYDLVEEISWYALKIGALVISSLGVILFMFAAPSLAIFTSQSHLIELGIPYLRLDVFTFPLIVLTILISRIMQGLGYGLPGLVLNLIRVFGIAIPLAYVFVFALGHGYLSVAGAMIIGALVSSVWGVWWLNKHFRELEKKMKTVG